MRVRVLTIEFGPSHWLQFIGLQISSQVVLVRSRPTHDCRATATHGPGAPQLPSEIAKQAEGLGRCQSCEDHNGSCGDATVPTAKSRHGPCLFGHGHAKCLSQYRCPRLSAYELRGCQARAASSTVATAAARRRPCPTIRGRSTCSDAHCRDHRSDNCSSSPSGPLWHARPRSLRERVSASTALQRIRRPASKLPHDGYACCLGNCHDCASCWHRLQRVQRAVCVESEFGCRWVIVTPRRAAPTDIASRARPCQAMPAPCKPLPR